MRTTYMVQLVKSKMFIFLLKNENNFTDLGNVSILKVEVMSYLSRSFNRRIVAEQRVSILLI